MTKNCVILLMLIALFQNQIEAQPETKTILGNKSKIPLQVDLSISVHFPPIINQGTVGSCDWCAVTYYQMTYMINKQLNRKATPENTFSPQFGYGFSCNAQSFPMNIRVDDVYIFATKHGMGNMANIPYKMKDGTGYKEWCTDESIWEDAINYRLAGYNYFTFNNKSKGAAYSLNNADEFLKEIKRLLNEGEVLVIQSETHKGKTSVIKNDPETDEDDAMAGQQIIYEGNNGYDHTVAVVGYNDYLWYDANNDNIVQLNEKGAIKIVDSFGTDYPITMNKGFHWMTYSTFVNSIAENRVNRLILRNSYTPKVICKITLNTAERDKIKFQFGRNLTEHKEDIASDNSKIFDPYMLGYNSCTAGVSLIEGGNCAYDGTTLAKDGTFVFDLTDIYLPGNKGFWYLKISNNSQINPCIIKKFEIINKETNKLSFGGGLPLSIINCEKYIFAGIE